jgi:hypothetical protein
MKWFQKVLDKLEGKESLEEIERSKKLLQETRKTIAESYACLDGEAKWLCREGEMPNET